MSGNDLWNDYVQDHEEELYDEYAESDFTDFEEFLADKGQSMEAQAQMRAEEGEE